MQREQTVPRASSRARTLVAVLVIVATLALATAIVYWTGGTRYAYPYLLFVPILLAAGLYGVPGALVVATLSALALGPYMPLNVEQGVYQSTENWLTRMAFLTGLGGFAGVLFQRLRAQARRDPRSGLANQVALESELQADLTRARLQRQWVGVALIRATDIDEVLDAVGADAGDEVITALADHLGKRLPVKRMYRYSASSLAATFNQVDEESLRAHAATVRDLGEESLTVRGIPVRLELCTGLALSGDDEEPAHELVRRARIAMSVAQRRERDFYFYSEVDERQSAETVRLVAKLRDALKNREFELHYQPKIQLDPDGAAGDRVTSVEGLIRWRPPGQDLIPPGRFVNKVERTRLIVPLTQFVVDEANAFAEQHPGLRVSVNLAPRTLQDEELINRLVERLAGSAIEPGRLEFEVTESALMTEPATSGRNLQRLRELGARVSIDDFGTGYASFEYLQRLPVTGLKIDQTFLRHLTSDGRTRNLVECMIRAGQGLGLTVTAEGVESPEAVEVLRELGCEEAQGFFYTPALPQSELGSWLSERGFEPASRPGPQAPSRA